MNNVTSFFFSKILNNEVSNTSYKTIGKLIDFIVDFSKEKPTVTYIKIKSGRKFFYIPADVFEISKNDKEKYSIKLKTESLLIELPSNQDILLAKDFLDKQIVDINGKRVERVNDVRIGNINGKWQLVAVDIGTRGLMRRLGIEYPFIVLTNVMRFQVRNRLIVWNNVQPLSTGVDNLQLYSPANKIETLHAADIADIIEDLDNKSRDILFNSLNKQKAAEVFEEIETGVQINLLNSMSDKKATDIFEIMPSDEIADILEEIEEDRVEKLLTQMDEESQEEIRELMEYDTNTVGSIMSKDFITFLPDLTVEDVLNLMQQNIPEDEETYYLYITNNKNNLLGTISLFTIVTSNKDTKLYNIMTTQSNCLTDEDKIEEAVEMMQKYSLISLPVIDENNELVGTISLNDTISELISSGRISI